MSAALSLIYSLSIASNIPTNISFISFNAKSALTFSVFTLSIVEPSSSGSSKTNKCDSNICASSSPNSTFALSLTFSSSVFDIATASFNLAISVSTSDIDFFSMTNSLCSNTNAFPSTIPGDAAVPLNIFFTPPKIYPYFFLLFIIFPFISTSFR